MFSNGDSRFREREFTINNETQKKFLMNSIRKVESFNKFSTTNIKDNVKNHKVSNADFMVETVLMQNTVEN